MAKRAGILIIGNEILSGKTPDANSHYFCRELRNLGVDVREVLVIPDEVATIADRVRDFSTRFDLVFTSGGVGPTHDDVTIEGIARGFGVPVVRHGALVEILAGWYRGELNEHRLKMATVPEGARLVTNGSIPFPLIVFRNIYIFPGIPEILREKFESVREEFRDSPFHLTNVYLSVGEGVVAGTLHEIVEAYPDLLVGSYPVLNNSTYRVKITLESKDPAYLRKATETFLASLPEDAVVEVATS